MTEELVFTIHGNEYDRVKRFKEEHLACIEKHSNMTCAQFEFSFIEDGLGLFKTVTCICGDYITLTDEYDSTSADHDPFQVVPTDTETVELVCLTLQLRDRPGMLTEMADDKSYRLLHAYLAGRSCSNHVFAEMMGKGIRRLEKLCEGKKYTDAEKYDLFFDCFEDTLREEYPCFAKENNLLKGRKG